MRIGQVINRARRMREDRDRQEALRRLNQRYVVEPQVFGTQIPVVSKQDMSDYRTSYGTPWPLRDATDDEIALRQDAYEGPVQPFKMPQQWQHPDALAQQALERQHALEWQKKDMEAQALQARRPSGMTVGDVTRQVYGFPEEQPQWSEPVLHPGMNAYVAYDPVNRKPTKIGDVYTPETESQWSEPVLHPGMNAYVSYDSETNKPMKVGAAYGGDDDQARKNRRRSYILRLMGVNDVYGYDETIANKVQEIDILTDQYEQLGMPENQATYQAFKDVTKRYETAENSPQANERFFGTRLKNEDEVKSWIDQMRSQGWDDPTIESYLQENGVKEEQIPRLMGAPGPASAPAQQTQQPQAQQITPEMKQRYFDLRSQGYTKEQAIAEITRQ